MCIWKRILIFLCDKEMKTGRLLKADGIIRMLSIFIKKWVLTHFPLTQGYDMTRQCRWMSVLHLEGQTKEQVFKAFPSKTRQNIKNALKYNIKVRKLEKDELSILHDLVSMTGERRHFSSLSLEYYREQYEYFKDKLRPITLIWILTHMSKIFNKAWIKKNR